MNYRYYKYFKGVLFMLIRLKRLSVALTVGLLFSMFLGAAHVNAQAGTETPTLPDLYKKINPSVVNIEVTIPASADSAGLLPTIPSLPNGTPDANSQGQLQFA